jgi:hypothetical protein
MSKGRKPEPPPTPALTEQDIAHLNWIQRNSTQLARSALTFYRRDGRGAFVVKEEDAQPSGTAARYCTVNGVLASGIVWSDENTAALVRTYDPAQQFVVVFLYHSGAASSYTIRFAKMGDTFTVEAA